MKDTTNEAPQFFYPVESRQCYVNHLLSLTNFDELCVFSSQFLNCYGFDT